METNERRVFVTLSTRCLKVRSRDTYRQKYVRGAKELVYVGTFRDTTQIFQNVAQGIYKWFWFGFYGR